MPAPVRRPHDHSSGKCQPHSPRPFEKLTLAGLDQRPNGASADLGPPVARNVLERQINRTRNDLERSERQLVAYAQKQGVVSGAAGGGGDGKSPGGESGSLEGNSIFARLAALVLSPRMHLTRYHGVFAPHSKHRAAITPARHGTGASKRTALAADSAKPATPRHVAMSWAQRLKRVFGIEIESCARCGEKLAIIASIEDPEVIAKILAHLEAAVPDRFQVELPLGARAPPSQGLLL